MTLADRGRTYDALGEAKRLLRVIRSGGLATLTPEGTPLASLVAVATMPDGAPILLLSRLAAHTRHLEGDRRCSLLLAEGGKGDPLAHPRLSLVGEAVPAGDQADMARRRFLARNPKSKLYADFPDFSFWILSITAAYLNGGFARAATFEGTEIMTLTDGCGDLVEGEDDAVTHMNQDHRDAVALYATTLAGLREGEWLLSGLDPDGLDLVCGDRTGRLRFPDPVASRSDLRRTLVSLADKARTSET